MSLSQSSKTAYLNAMGIDVWVLRTNDVSLQSEVPASADDRLAQPGASPGASPVSVVPAATRTLPEKSAAPVSAEVDVRTETEVPSFRFALLHYGEIGICVSLSGIDALPRRLCDDLARAVTKEREEPKFQELKWPMLQTSGVDQSANAAMQVVTQKLSTMPSRLIIIGNDVGDYYGPVSGATPFQVEVVGRQQILLIPSATTFMSSAELKRNLMPNLVNWRAG